MSSVNHVFCQSCLLSIMFSVKHVFCLSCLLSIMSSVNYVFCQSYLLSIMSSFNYVLCQSYLLSIMAWIKSEMGWGDNLAEILFSKSKSKILFFVFIFLEDILWYSICFVTNTLGNHNDWRLLTGSVHQLHIQATNVHFCQKSAEYVFIFRFVGNVCPKV